MTSQGPDHALSLEVRPVAIAADEQRIEAPTQETGTLAPIADREPAGRTAITMPRIAPGRYLAVEDGEDLVLYLLSDLMHIGRSPSADIVLDDASVSRRHALVTKRGDTTVILDDRSLNGVTVNGVRVSEKHLADGDTILVGHVAMRYVERL
jgi:pSer/pThr/pTyr-binding forkhead associated (FHA) protein